ncbi:MAG: hypothetical protein WC707_00775 [Candidatus Babeliaceae bacterium]|jgi:hypothetical protein
MKIFFAALLFIMFCGVKADNFVHALITLDNNLDFLSKTYSANLLYGTRFAADYPQLIINKNLFSPLEYCYQIRVLNQTGVVCGYHALKNLFLFLAALTAPSSSEEKKYLIDLESPEYFTQFNTKISTFLKKQDVCGALNDDEIARVINNIDRFSDLMPSASAQRIKSLIMPRVIVPNQFSPERKNMIIADGEAVFTEYERYSMPDAYKDVFIMYYIFSTIDPSYIDKLYNSKKNIDQELYGFVLQVGKGLTSAATAHWIAIVVNLHAQRNECFILNSIAGEGPFALASKEFITHYKQLNDLTLEGLQGLIVRVAVAQHNFSLESIEVLKKIHAESEEVVLPQKTLIFRSYDSILNERVQALENLMSTIRKYDSASIELFKNVYKPVLSKKINMLRDVIEQAGQEKLISEKEMKNLLARISAITLQ